MSVMAALAFALFAASLFCGTVRLDAGVVAGALFGYGDDAVAAMIVRDVRLPMAVTALMAGVALSVSGLLMQTVFANPLAGPSILGISTGASLGVAVVMLGLGGWLGSGIGYYAGILSGAFLGAASVMALLLLFSMLVRGNAMLLIVGILIGYLASSAISLLNFFSTQQGVHSYVIWGMGNFGGLTWERVLVFGGLCLVVTGIAFAFVKPLNALLLGRRYAESMGVNVRQTRNWLLVVSGALAAVVTAFCGPIGFLGLVMPHVARFATGTSNHTRLLPATALAGGAGALLCLWLSVVCGGGQMIPVNAITPLIAVPVIIYVIVSGRKL
ncbi:MAG: iron ABC transporter permease [Muribaculaceae bacterium]|nr:iron ABC transporter permease [Muribaculaceae bacterium]